MLRAATVSVGYAEELNVSLTYNRKHFDEYLVVTDREDSDDAKVAESHGCCVCWTDAFYRNGADFNKWLALEEGLDAFGRGGWLCMLDADTLLPRDLEIKANYTATMFRCRGHNVLIGIGMLFSPRRRMLVDYNLAALPAESEWDKLPLHPNVAEHAGYCQVFHGSDTKLPTPPWYETNWRHAGGADSFFQARWPAEQKCRPRWDVLHLGPAGRNWCGRVTRKADGSSPPEAAARAAKLKGYMLNRHASRSYATEKLP